MQAPDLIEAAISSGISYPFLIMMALFVSLNALDLVLTLIGLRLGAWEANPLMRRLYNRYGYPVFSIFKLAMVFVVVALALISDSFRKTAPAVFSLSLISLALMTFSPPFKAGFPALAGRFGGRKCPLGRVSGPLPLPLSSRGSGLLDP